MQCYYLIRDPSQSSFFLESPDRQDRIDIGDYLEGFFTGPLTNSNSRLVRPFLLTFSALSEPYNVMLAVEPPARDWIRGVAVSEPIKMVTQDRFSWFGLLEPKAESKGSVSFSSG